MASENTSVADTITGHINNTTWSSLQAGLGLNTTTWSTLQHDNGLMVTQNYRDVTPRATYETFLACLFLLIIMVTSLVGNTAVIAVVCLNRSMRKDRSNMLIVNLSITDLSNTVLVMLSALIALISDHWPLGSVWCDFVCAINYCLIIVSMLTLCCISIDRYQAVMHPLSYPIRITRKRMLMIIIYTWIQGVAVGTAPSFAGWVSYDYWEAICAIQWHLFRPDSLIYVILAFLFCFLIPGLVLVYCYTKILKEVKKQKSQIMTNTAGDSQTAAKSKKSISDRSKLVWSLLTVVFAYFVCTTPFSVTKLVKVIATDQSIMPGPINLTAALLGYVASAINPLIYGIFRRDFRKAYRNLVCAICLKDKFQNTMSTDVPSTSNIGTISKANNLTIHPEPHLTVIPEPNLTVNSEPNLTVTPKLTKVPSCSPKNVRFDTKITNGDISVEKFNGYIHNEDTANTNDKESAEVHIELTEDSFNQANSTVTLKANGDVHFTHVNGNTHFVENNLATIEHDTDIDVFGEECHEETMENCKKKAKSGSCRKVFVLSASQPFDDIQ